MLYSPSPSLAHLRLRLAAIICALAVGATPVAAQDAAKTPAVETEIIQESAADPAAVTYGESIATRYRVGAKITAKGGTVQNILVMVAVPLECPEQEVHVVEEDFSPHVQSVEFRQLPDTKGAEPAARQMLIKISELPARQEAHALITYEVVTKAILPPEDPSSLKIPARPDRHLKPYLSASPFINVNQRKIRDAVKAALAGQEKDEAKTTAGEDTAGTSESPTDEEGAAEIASGYEDVAPAGEPAATETPAQSKERAGSSPTPAPQDPAPASGLIGVDENAAFKADAKRPSTPDATAAEAPLSTPAAEPTGDWQRVEKIYDYVLEHVKYEEGAQDKPALKALQDGAGDCHGISALFVAMCRTAKVPARMVWVDGHQYAEFYLEDADGKGHWYPVQSAGTRAFGEMPTPKVILQKGDNFRVPERRRERLRYASDYTFLLAAPKYKPKVTYVREQL